MKNTTTSAPLSTSVTTSKKPNSRSLKKERIMKRLNTYSVKSIYLAILLSLVALLVGGTALAQENLTAPGRNVLSAPLPQGPTDPAELEAFLDELMAEQMEEYHIAGAAVSVVKDGELFFAKGYGYSDLENGTLVDPYKTVFRFGSSTKPLTWTAVMQLVEQGKLDLDADVNTYLDFRIPDTYPKPITVGDLMAHTSGFEYVVYEFLAMDADELIPAGEWLASHIPGRVRPPPRLCNGLFELQCRPGRIHRGARSGHALRPVHPGEHPGSTGDGGFDCLLTSTA
jgi:CubicO group peptidase (beta-lactamase class C family)